MKKENQGIRNRLIEFLQKSDRFTPTEVVQVNDLEAVTKSLIQTTPPPGNGNGNGSGQKVNPVGPLTVRIVGGKSRSTPQPWPYDFRAHAKVYLLNIYCYAASRAIAMDVAAVPVRVKRHEIIDGEERWVEVFEGELYDLIQEPNPEESFRQLTERTVLAYNNTGNAFNTYDLIDKELYYVNPTWVKVACDPFGKLLGYEIRNREYVLNLDYKQVLHWRMSNPNGEFYGMPPGEVIKTAIMTKLGLNKYLNKFFERDCMIGTTLSTNDALTPQQREAMREDMELMFQGTDNAFGLAILEQGTTLQKVAQLLRDLVPKQIDEMIRGEVLAAYRVPPVKIGFLDGATYANAEVQNSQYYADTVVPAGRAYIEVLNRKLVKPYFGAEYKLDWDESEIKALQEDENMKSVRVQGEWKAGLRRFNEAREALGLKPVDESEGGEEFYTAPQPIAYPTSGNNNTEQNDREQNEDDEDAEGDNKKSMKKPSMITVKRFGVPRNILWKSIDVRRRPKDEVFYQFIQKYLLKQRDRILDDIKYITKNGRFMSRLMIGACKDPINNPNQIDALFDIIQENEILQKESGYVMTRIVREAGEETIAAFNLGLSFDVENPNVRLMLQKAKNRITDINKTTYEQLKRTFIESYDSGDSMQALAQKIKEQYSHLASRKGRAITIARTETGALVNGGTVESYSQNGVVKMEWLATKDGVCRPEHGNPYPSGADGEIIRVGDKFMGTGEPLDNPCDPNGSGWNVINCRCTTIPVIE